MKLSGQSKIQSSSGIFRRHISTSILILSVAACSSGCTPRVEIAPPTEPITINMNVKIDHEVKVRVEKDLESVIGKDSDLF